MEHARTRLLFGKAIPPTAVAPVMRVPAAEVNPRVVVTSNREIRMPRKCTNDKARGVSRCQNETPTDFPGSDASLYRANVRRLDEHPTSVAYHENTWLA